MDEIKKTGPRPKYPQPKSVHISGRLTQRGADWLEDHGGLDYIDRLAWGIEDEGATTPKTQTTHKTI